MDVEEKHILLLTAWIATVQKNCNKIIQTDVSFLMTVRYTSCNNLSKSKDEPIDEAKI